MNDWKDDILVALLDCGYCDLSVLEDCQYDMADIVEQCKDNFGKIDLNRLACTMFDFGRADIESKRLERVDEFKNELNKWDNAIEGEQELTDEEQEKYDALKSDIELLEKFDVYENLESFHNYLDTSIWVTGTSNNERIHELLKDAFEEFEENTGYSIG